MNPLFLTCNCCLSTPLSISETCSDFMFPVAVRLSFFFEHGLFCCSNQPLTQTKELLLKQEHTPLHSIPLVPETGQGMNAGDVESWTETPGLVWASVLDRSRCSGSGAAILSRTRELASVPFASGIPHNSASQSSLASSLG